MILPKTILGPMRLPFLILTPSCVLLGFGTAIWSAGHVNAFYFILALIGAVSAHISVNAFNEYFDFKSGLDFKTERTPFSGGSGTLPGNPEKAPHALITAVAASACTTLIGLFFLFVHGLALLPLGVLGLILVFTYTPLLAYNPYLCLIAPGLGFGPAMVMGTHFVLTGEYSWSAFAASLIPFFLVSNLLLLNQFPDVSADKSIGRKHFPIVIGTRSSSILFSIFMLCAYLSLSFGVLFHRLPKMSMIGLLTILLAVPAGIGAFRYADNIKRLIPFMGMNVIINIATPALVAIGLIIE